MSADRWNLLMQALAGGEPAPLPAWTGPRRVHLLPRDLDEPDEEPPPVPKPAKPAPTPKPPRQRPPRPRKQPRRTAADILTPRPNAPRW